MSAFLIKNLSIKNVYNVANQGSTDECQKFNPVQFFNSLIFE